MDSLNTTSGSNLNIVDNLNVLLRSFSIRDRCVLLSSPAAARPPWLLLLLHVDSDRILAVDVACGYSTAVELVDVYEWRH